MVAREYRRGLERPAPTQAPGPCRGRGGRQAGLSGRRHRRGRRVGAPGELEIARTSSGRRPPRTWRWPTPRSVASTWSYVHTPPRPRAVGRGVMTHLARVHVHTPPRPRAVGGGSVRAEVCHGRGVPSPRCAMVVSCAPRCAVVEVCQVRGVPWACRARRGVSWLRCARSEMCQVRGVPWSCRARRGVPWSRCAKSEVCQVRGVPWSWPDVS